MLRIFQACSVRQTSIQNTVKLLASQFCTAGNVTRNNDTTFKDLLDNSLLMKFGQPDSKCVVGKITDVCNDDLYIDFGAKFEAVVKRPEDKNDFYQKGALVRLILKKFEMTGAFLGDERHITLCEADAILVGPYTEQFDERRKQQKSSKAP